MTPHEYTAEKAAPRGSSTYYALFFAPPEHRAALKALHAFQHEVCAVPRTVNEPEVARAKLGWWRDEVDRMFQGAGRHPISKALHQPLERYNLAREYFEEIIQGAEMDLDYNAYPSFSQLALYCHRTGTSLPQLAIEVCGYDNRDTTRYAHDLGMGLRLLSILRNVRTDARTGRIYIPEDELREYQVDRATLLQPQTSERLRALFAAQADRITDFFSKALERLPAEDRYRQRSGLIQLVLYRRLLQEIRAAGFPLLEREIHLTPLHKFWIALRTARRPDRV